MYIEEVITIEQKRAFLELPLKIYADDKNYIRPLDKDVEEVFDPVKNKFFKKGECTRWLFKDNSGNYFGRVATFVNRQYKQDQPTGGIGFFECINDEAAARFIFDHCKNWLSERGMEAMDGPINFGERERWWGLQVSGFQPPLYCMNYNLPYYQALFEDYGFKLYFNQVCFSLKVKDPLPEKHPIRHGILSKDPGYTAKHIVKSEISQFAKDFTLIYNKAWAGHGGGKSLEERTVQKMFAAMKPVIDEEITWFAYYNGEPIAMWVNLPDLNQYFKKFKGKFGLIEKLRFLFMQRFGKCSRFVGLVFGVVPEHQGKGADSFLITEGAKIIQKRMKYEDYEMLWIGDFNPKMINIAESLGTHRSRRLVTYRFLFDGTKEFKRHPML